MPYSAIKAKCQGHIKYWKLRVQQVKGVSIDQEELSKLQELYTPNVDGGEGREYCISKLQNAKEQWNQMKE